MYCRKYGSEVFVKNGPMAGNSDLNVIILDFSSQVKSRTDGQ